MMHRFAFALLFSLATIGSLAAQKIGHVNFGNLISLMPATKSADTEILNLSNKLQEQYASMADKLTKDIKTAQENYNAVTPVRLKEIEQELFAQRQKLAQFQQSISLKVEEKRRELLKPIIEESKVAIDKIAKAQGYDIVIDSSIFSAVLYAEDTVDLTKAIMAELGITE